MRINRLNRLYKYGWAFGLSQACVLLSFRFGFMRLYNKALGWKKTAVVNYVKQHYAHIINRYGALDSKPAAVGDDFVVWFFWDNEVMPPIVRKCYEALLVNSNGHEVRL